MNAIRQTLSEPGDVTAGALHEQRLAAIGVLAGGIAHDFNNILNVILGYGERALRNVSRGSRLRRDLENILAAGERGRSLVEQVLTLGQDDVIERVSVDVEALVREALELLAPGLPRGIVVETTFEAGRAAMLGQAIDVHRLFMNLATNAIRAMPDGGTFSVSVTTEHVAVARAAAAGSLEAGDYIVVQVADSGVGIAPMSMQRIFDRFFTTRQDSGGTGLGLSLVHDIVLDAGGAIDVESRLGAGSRFTAYLPRADHPQRDER